MNLNNQLQKMNPSQLQTLIEQASARLSTNRNEDIQSFRLRTLAQLRDEGLSFEEVFGNYKATRLMRAKFVNPEDPSQTWTGHGKRPRWYIKALKAGKKPESLLMENVVTTKH